MFVACLPQLLYALDVEITLHYYCTRYANVRYRFKSAVKHDYCWKTYLEISFRHVEKLILWSTICRRKIRKINNSALLLCAPFWTFDMFNSNSWILRCGLLFQELLIDIYFNRGLPITTYHIPYTELYTRY